jgi:outer membrane protein assembly factor BamB/tetratricopeptide (TPR) repeat protein
VFVIEGKQKVAVDAGRRMLICLALCVAFCAPGLAQAPQKGPVVLKPKDKSAPSDTKATFVSYDPEYAQLLDEARKLLDNPDDPDSMTFGFEILQTMINRGESFYPLEENSSLFVGLRVKANEILGELTPDGLKKYRDIYDASAKRIYDQAQGGDLAKLHQVVDQYRYTSYGTKAMDLLGSVYFDRGRFAQAASAWQLLLASHPPEEQVPLILAKTATAYHLAGMGAMAEKMVKALKDRYPMASAEFSGAKQNLQEFVRQARLIQPEALGMLPDFLRPKHIFPGLGGVPDGASVMGECDTLLVSRWLLTANEQNGIKDHTGLKLSELMALQEVLDSPQPNGQSVTCRMVSGQVQLRGGGQMGNNILAPAILPVVVDDLVIYRTNEGVVACNIITGEVVWKKDHFPMRRTTNVSLQNWGWQPMLVEDLGRYTMTLGAGKLYAVGNYRAWMHPNQIANLPPDQKKTLFDSSTLVALSLKKQGGLCWQVGNGQGDDDIVRFGKILCAPTYNAGKLYVMASYTESYHLLCLDADTGKLLWKNTISQSPQPGGMNPWNGAVNPSERSGPLAVADGRVFVLTNAAVVAAFDADSGQPLWAFQYDSPTGANTNRGYFNNGQASVGDRTVNPILAVGGRVVFLPTDSNSVFCLSAEDGKPVWTQTVTRREQHDLSYIDEGRFLLSGPGMYVMNAADGKELYGRSNAGIVGRPVVNTQAALCSGQGKLHRLDMQKYVVSTIDLISPEAVLGNLVCVDGVLVASNAAGICAYFNYAQAFQRMSDRIAQATPEEKLQLTYQRAQVSFSAKRIPSALQDLLDCQKMAKDQNNAEMTDLLAPRLYRAYVAMANHGANPQQMVEYIRKSGEYGVSDQDKALYMLRLAKCNRKAGDLKAALSGAQELGEKMADQLLADVVVGPEADDTVRQDSSSQRTARSVAQDLIGEIVDSGAEGRAAYKDFDDLAKAKLEKARQAHDPEAMIAVASAWPHSLYADEAQFTAAQEYYRKSLKPASPEDASVALGNVMKYLSIAANGKGKYRAPARLAIAMIFKQSGSMDMAQLALDQLEGVDPQSEFSFADLHGKLSDLLKQVGPAPVLPPIPDVSMLKGSMEQLYAIPGQSVTVLTDQKNMPVRLGDQVLVLKDDRMVLVDTQARDAESAITWSALSTVHLPPAATDASAFYSPQYKHVIAGLSKDKKVIGVVDYETACGLDVRSAKIVWRHAMGEYGGRLEPGMLSIGEGMLVFGDQTGRVCCVDLFTGDLAWSSEPAKAVQGIVVAPTISNGMVMARCNGGRCLVCWDIKSGKILATIESKRDAANGAGNGSANGMFTPQGLLVTLVDDELSVREPKNLERAVWVRKYPGQFSALGAALSDRVVVTPDVRTSNDLDVVSLVSGAVIQTLHLGDIQNTPAMPMLRDCQSPKFRDTHTIMCDVLGQNLYVTCTRNPQSGAVGFNSFNGQPLTPGISIQKFDLKSGKREWQSDIEAEGSTYFVPALVVGQTHVMFCPGASMKENAESSDAKVYVIDAADGKLVNTLDPSKSKADQAGQNRLGFRLMTPAVMTNGKILMENIDGVTVYGGGN